MGSVYPRGRKLWIKYKSGDGKWIARPTEYVIGQEKQARSVLELVEQKISAGEKFAEAELGEVTVERYAKRWLDSREHHVRSVNDERTRMTKHVFPRIGKLKLSELRPRHIRDLILELRAVGELAPRTIRSVYGTLHSMLRDAVVDELIESNPCILKRGVLPKKVDKDPAWRSTAIFTRAEVEQLISDERLLADRRVLYGLKALAGLRHGEAAGLTWSRFDPSAEPLGRLTIASSYTREGTKTEVTREVPVHPSLAKLLASWRLSGWEETFGRKPTPQDFIVPTRRFNVRAAAEAHWAFHRDLKLLGLRSRRGHDLRRAFITLAQVDGARRDLLEAVTHGPRGDIVSIYTTFPWPALCGEVAKLNVSLLEGKVLKLRAAAASERDDLGTSLGTADLPSCSHRREVGATPTGFEPVSPT